MIGQGGQLLTQALAEKNAAGFAAARHISTCASSFRLLPTPLPLGCRIQWRRNLIQFIIGLGAFRTKMFGPFKEI